MTPTLIHLDDQTRHTLVEALQPIITSMCLDDDYLKFVIQLEHSLLASETPLSSVVLDEEAIQRVKELLLLALPLARGIARQRQLTRLLNRL